MSIKKCKCCDKEIVTETTTNDGFIEVFVCESRSGKVEDSSDTNTLLNG